MLMNPYIEILRPNVAFLSVLGIVVGSLVSGAFSFPLLVALASIAAFLITGAGNAFNDYFDYRIDRVNRPGRPIPSGRISRRNAFNYAVIINLLGLGLASLVSLPFLEIAFLNTIVLFVYAWKLKAKPFVGNLSVAYLSASTFLAAGLITSGFSSLPGSAVFILSLISLFGTLGREIFKDIEDIKGDRLSGARTLPIMWGEGKSRTLAYASLYFACLLLILPLYFGMFGFPYLAGAAPAAALCIYAIKTPPAKTQRLIKKSMYLVFLGFILGSLL